MLRATAKSFKLTFFDELSDALVTFSRDLVKLVHQYIAYNTATTDAKPRNIQIITSSLQWKFAGVACSHNRIFLSGGNKVSVFSSNGEFLYLADGQNSRWFQAEGVAVAQSGELYVVDTSAHSIVVCAADGSFVRRIGSCGREPGQFTHPKFIAVRSRPPLMYVTQGSALLSLQVLTLDGDFVRAFGDFSGASGVAVNAYGEIAVSDRQTHSVQVCSLLFRLFSSCFCAFLQVFNSTGDHLCKFGRYGQEKGQLREPYGVACDSQGNWLVSELVNHRVSIFKSDGAFITTITWGLHSPMGVCCDGEGRILVADDQKRCVFVFGFSYPPV